MKVVEASALNSSNTAPSNTMPPEIHLKLIHKYCTQQMVKNPLPAIKAGMNAALYCMHISPNKICELFPMELIGEECGWRKEYIDGNGVDGDVWVGPDDTAYLV